MNRFFPRIAGIVFLLALFASPLSLFAQDDAVNVVGSGIVAPLLQALADASGAEANVNVSVTGTNSGFNAFCQGSADVTTATRTISPSEEAACSQNGISFLELLIGHHVVAFVANPATDFTQCLTTVELTTALAPSAEGQVTNWNQINASYADTPLTVLGTGPDTPVYALTDAFIEGDALRSDLGVQATDADTIAAVGTTVGALGVVNYEAAVTAGDSVKILQIDAGTGSGCAAPSAENVENRTYGAANQLMIYVNAASLSKTKLQALLTFAASDEAASAVTEAGFTAPTADAYTRDRDILANSETGRTFSRENTDFTIPQDIVGTITVAGSPTGFDYINGLSTLFTGQYPGVTTEIHLIGQPNGFTRLCNNEIDITVAYSAITPEQQTACDTNGIRTVDIDLGREAVVVVANAANEYLTCLTTDQLATLWRVNSGDAITKWNQVSDTFPETDITLFAPPDGSPTTDLLLINTAGADVPARIDVAEQNPDPLYRAAATANVDGALTYMNWTEYQSVLANNQANIQLVSVDAGAGCVAPSETTIADGSYPLTRPLRLLVRQSSLNKAEVQSFLWYLASDENYSALTDHGFVGLSFGQLPDLRNRLEQEFAQAALQETIDLQATPEATSEAVTDTTPEAASEAPAEATTEATSSATADATAEATAAS
jgi:ABC-type phosphate transport system substrate-binding protein